MDFFVSPEDSDQREEKAVTNRQRRVDEILSLCAVILMFITRVMQAIVRPDTASIHKIFLLLQ